MAVISPEQLQFVTDASNSLISFVNGKYSISRIVPMSYKEDVATKKKEIGLLIKTSFFATDKFAKVVFNSDAKIDLIEVT